MYLGQNPNTLNFTFRICTYLHLHNTYTLVHFHNTLPYTHVYLTFIFDIRFDCDIRFGCKLLGTISLIPLYIYTPTPGHYFVIA